MRMTCPTYVCIGFVENRVDNALENCHLVITSVGRATRETLRASVGRADDKGGASVQGVLEFSRPRLQASAVPKPRVGYWVNRLGFPKTRLVSATSVNRPGFSGEL